MNKIYIENIPISFTRKNIKNINIRINSPDGEVMLSAPFLVSMKQIEKFVISKKEWIISSQKKVIEASKKKEQFTKHLFDNAKTEKEVKELKKYYANELLLISQGYFEKWKNSTGLSPNEVVVRWPKNLWGTCEKKSKKIMLNGKLIAFDKRYLDYVILHELTHLKYSNHGQDFKNFMTKYMPDWKEIRKELNGK